MPKVSVIIPNYNHARFLRQRIESVLGQTFGDLELIFVDDASTDDSAHIFERFSGDPRVRSHFNTVNSGSAFAQWNKGVGMARGTYVWIAESDDYADPRFLERLVPILDATPSLGIAYAQSVQIDAEGRHLRRLDALLRYALRERWTADFTCNGREICREAMLFENVIPNASAVLFRREAYESAGGADPSYRLSGDWKLWVDILRRWDLAFIAEPLNFFRTHEASLRTRSARSGAAIAERYRIHDYITQNLDIEPVLQERAKDAMAELWVYHLIDHRPRPAQLMQLWREARGHDPHLLRRLPSAFWRCLVRWNGRRRSTPVGH